MNDQKKFLEVVCRTVLAVVEGPVNLLEAGLLLLLATRGRMVSVSAAVRLGVSSAAITWMSTKLDEVDGLLTKRRGSRELGEDARTVYLEISERGAALVAGWVARSVATDGDGDGDGGVALTPIALAGGGH